MISKKFVPVLLISTVLAASVSNVAMAHDRDGLAIAAGIIGAVAAGTIIANSVPAPVVVAPQPVMQPVYPSAPQVTYYQTPPAPVYYQPAPVYYRPAPVYVERDYYRPPHYHYDDRYDGRY